MAAVNCRRLAVLLQAEERASLPLPQGLPAAIGRRAYDRLVHVPEEVSREAPCRVDLGKQRLRARIEPLRSLVGEEQRGVMAGKPVGDIAAAKRRGAGGRPRRGGRGSRPR